jgi:hypothetical protein
MRMDPRKLINSSSQATDVSAPVKTRQSLIYRSTSAEVPELPGSEYPSSVLRSNSLQDRIRCVGRHVRFYKSGIIYYLSDIVNIKKIA